MYLLYPDPGPHLCGAVDNTDISHPNFYEVELVGTFFPDSIPGSKDLCHASPRHCFPTYAAPNLIYRPAVPPSPAIGQGNELSALQTGQNRLGRLPYSPLPDMGSPSPLFPQFHSQRACLLCLCLSRPPATLSNDLPKSNARPCAAERCTTHYLFWCLTTAVK